MIENITQIAPIETSVSAIHSLLNFGYWFLGGAIGIAILTIIFNLLYKSRHIILLERISEQNEKILEQLKLLNKRKK